MAITHSTVLPLRYGLFQISYHKFEEGDCVSVSYGNLTDSEPIVRFHSSCLFGESFHSLHCDCADQLSSTLKLIKKNGSGVILYQYVEGRGIGLENKIKALEIQRTQKVNTVEAFRLLGFKPDIRTYEREIASLHDLQINNTIKIAGQNPRKAKALTAAGFTIAEVVHPIIRLTKYNIAELLVKRDLMGYDIGLEDMLGAA